MIRQALSLIIISIILGLCINIFSPNSIPYVGNYRNISVGNKPIIPPTAEPSDPPFMSIDNAVMEYNFKEAKFIDARSYEEFACGTIPGSMNIPFEYLPETDVEQYIDSSLDLISKDSPIIVFCSGDECDLSLQLARLLQELKYTGVKIFYGGAREWENTGLEIERRMDCGN